MKFQLKFQESFEKNPICKKFSRVPQHFFYRIFMIYNYLYVFYRKRKARVFMYIIFFMYNISTFLHVKKLHIFSVYISRYVVCFFFFFLLLKLIAPDDLGKSLAVDEVQIDGQMSENTAAVMTVLIGFVGVVDRISRALG